LTPPAAASATRVHFTANSILRCGYGTNVGFDLAQFRARDVKTSVPQ
jgi:hypothetical protein